MTFIVFFNKITTMKNFPKCVDCKHYFVPKLIYGVSDTSAQSKCTKYKIHTKPYTYEYAYLVRSDKTMCGPSGTKFDPNTRTLN